MKKIMLLILSFMFLATPQETFNEDYRSEIREAYSDYTMVCNYSSPNYSIIIVKGIVNDEATYGIAFFSEKANEYYLRFDVDGKIYKTDTNTRGDVRIIGINWQNYDKITINIYNRNGELQYPTHMTSLEKFSKDEFDSLNAGENKGTNLTKLRSETSGIDIEFRELIITFLIIISFCVIVILVMAKTKKGFFNPSKRKDSVFDFKAFVTKEDEVKENTWITEEDIKEEVHDESDNDYFKEEVKDTSTVNVSEYLKDKGFMSDYSLASEEEKNMIMLELMRLRDEAKISKDVYLEETYKLWKK